MHIFRVYLQNKPFLRFQGGANRGKMAIGIRAGKTEENEDMVAGNAGMVAGRNGIMTIFP